MKLKMAFLCVAMAIPATTWAFHADVTAPANGDQPLAVGGGISFGVLDGQAKEHVYDYEGPGGSRRQLSRLDWDLKNIGMCGAQFSIRPMAQLPIGNRMTINAGIWGSLTEGNGEMEDYDWEDETSTDWTRYSLSDVNVIEGYIFDINVAFDLVSLENFALRAFVGYKQDGWSWEDKGRYLLYPEYNYIPQDLYGETMILYEQEFRIPYIGVSADLSLGGFTLSGRISYSPSVEATDWDAHLARKVFFEEEFEGGEMFGLGVDLRYAFANGVFLTASADYQVIDLIVGDMRAYDATDKTWSGGRDIAGIENSYLSLMFGGGFRF